LQRNTADERFSTAPSALLYLLAQKSREYFNKDKGAVEKRSSAVLRCKPHRSTYIYTRLAIRFLRALHLNIFEQPH
jgi:hypothetical protein